MENQLSILLASSDSASRLAVSEALRDTQFQPLFARSVFECLDFLIFKPVCLILCEENLPGGGYREVLVEVEYLGGTVPLVVLSRTGEWNDYLRAIRLGALDMITPPYHRSLIRILLHRVFRESSAREVSIQEESAWPIHLYKDYL